jgi:hypothetical protein
MKNFDNGEYGLTKEELSNPDLEGVFISPDGKTMFDRRYDAEFVQKSNVLTPRNADLNLIGAEIVEVPEELQTRYRVGTRASVKQELLRLGLPGVNV